MGNNTPEQKFIFYLLTVQIRTQKIHKGDLAYQKAFKLFKYNYLPDNFQTIN